MRTKYILILLVILSLLFITAEGARRQQKQQRQQQQNFYHQQQQQQQYQRQQQQQRQQRQNQQKKSKGADYYKLLEVPRNADTKQIRRSFKKLSLKYHPDKNKENAKEAEQKFQEIANAYEVLMDPEQKEIYDKYGEQGLKEGKGREQQQQQHQWGNFFQNFQQEQPQTFEKSDVFQLNLSNINYFYRRREVWLFFFFKNNDRKSMKHVELVKEMAQKFYGIFKVAAIDCGGEDDVLCEDEFQAYSYPMFKVYEANISVEGEEFQKRDINLNSLAGFAISKMENFVRYLSMKNYEDFLNSDKETDKIVLLTKSKNTPPLLKSLSKDLRGKLSFGMVRESETELINKFRQNLPNKNMQLPILLALTDGSNFKGDLYDDKFDKDRVMIFLRPFAYKQKTVVKEPRLQEMTPSLSKQSGSCAKNDKNYCFLTIYEPQQKDNTIEILTNLSKIYVDEPISFYYVEKSDIEYPNILDDNEQINEFPAAVVIKGKRSKYVRYTGQEFEIRQIQNFIDDILGGGGSYKEMFDTLKGNVFSKQEKQKSDL